MSDWEPVEKLIRSIEKSNLEDICREPQERLLEWWENVNVGRDGIRDGHIGGDWSHGRMQEERARVEFVRLRIASGLQRAKAAMVGSLPFKDAEYTFLETFEHYAMFDGINVDQLVTHIARREGQVFGLIKECVDGQILQYDTLLEDTDLPQDLRNGLRRMYQIRFAYVQEAIVKYIKTHPASFTRVFSEIEEAVIKLYGLEAKRIEIQHSAEGLALKADEHESIMKELAILQQQRADLAAEVAGARHNLEAAGQDRAALETELSAALNHQETLAQRVERVREVWQARFTEMEGTNQTLAAQKTDLEKLREEASTENQRLIDAAEEKRQVLEEQITSERTQYTSIIDTIGAENDGLKDRITGLKERMLGETTLSPQYVSALTARSYEDHFIDQFRTKAHMLSGTKIKLVGRAGEVKGKLEVGNGGTSDQRPWLHDRYVVKEKTLRSSDLDRRVPLNRRAWFPLIKRPLLGATKRVGAFEAAALNHLDEFAHNYSDDSPIGVAELTAQIGSRREWARSRGIHMVVCFSSPTGFSEEAIARFSGSDIDHRFMDPHISVCLLDSLASQIIFDKRDPALSGDHMELFSAGFEIDRIDECEKEIRRLFDEEFQTEVTFADLGDRQEAHIRCAYQRLIKAGDGEMIKVKVDGKKVIALHNTRSG